MVVASEEGTPCAKAFGKHPKDAARTVLTMMFFMISSELVERIEWGARLDVGRCPEILCRVSQPAVWKWESPGRILIEIRLFTVVNTRL
jgi:hypothetical protein